MSKKIRISNVNPVRKLEKLPESSGFGKDYYKWVINEKMNVLRSRLLNLADTITDDKERREAIKGLIKDFCSDAYYPLLKDIRNYLVQFKVIDEDTDEMPPRLREEERID